jgi:orotidine-5'-phosphate decarboxylase
MDKLQKLVEEKNSRVCVGLDPTEIPEMLSCQKNVSATLRFCKDIILAVKDFAVAVKPNIAFYESKGVAGLAVYEALVKFASEQNLFVIGDVKRSDIGKTAEQYAKAYLYQDSPFDMITINPLFGSDGVLPFIKLAEKNNKGIYVLVKTSNKTSGELQDLIVNDGLSISETIALYTNVWGENLIGTCGYSSIGAVVGATYPEHAAILRNNNQTVPFLVPGYGSQGATAQDVAHNFDSKGNGALVNASSSIMYAYKKQNTTDYATAAAEETKRMRDSINSAIFN